MTDDGIRAPGDHWSQGNKIIVDVDGDASFSMTAMELATAAQYDIGVKALVMNNEFQGMVLPKWKGEMPSLSGP